MHRARPLLILGVLAMILAGCQLHERANSGRGSANVTRTGNWPFWPTSMRVHPLTRLSADHEAGEPVLEVRLEFIDPDGHPTRAAGLVTVELHHPLSGLQPIGVWNHDLSDMQVNRRHYDDVTQTYLLRLRVSVDDLPARVLIQARFVGDDEALLDASREINLGGGR